MPMRINKYLSQSGTCSRREADRLIQAGQVSINGHRAKPGDQVMEGDRVTFFGKNVRGAEHPVYIALHKPVGYITTTSRKSKDNVLDLVKNVPERLFPVGRLDVESSGLLLLTNDGETANKLMHPRYEHEKEYEVAVHRPISDAQLAHLARGITLEDGKTAPAQTRRIGPKSFTITLKEGRNRQIRRMCEALNLDVVKLHRVRIQSLRLGDLKSGAWRHLTSEEASQLTKTG